MKNKAKNTRLEKHIQLRAIPRLDLITHLKLKGLLLPLLLVMVLLFRQNLLAQTNEAQVSINGYYDQVSDRFGNKFNLADINTTSTKPFGSTAVVNVSTISCSSGRFVLYFDATSIFSVAAVQSVICEVAANISGFLVPPSASPDPVRIYCRNSLTSGLLAAATGIYVYPIAPQNPNQGKIRNQVEKTLISGVDAYNNLPLASFYSGNYYYHGRVELNPLINWNTAMNSLTLAANQYDLYQVLHHEFLHMLGFASLIDNNGYSKIGVNNNFFTKYDTYLKSPGGTPLLASTGTLCNNGSNNLAFNTASLSLITPSNCVNTGSTSPDITSTCSATVVYSSSATNATVYVPDCFENASTFSHFEDMCTYPSTFTSVCTPTPASPGFNNMYFLMANAASTGTCFINRFMRPEEMPVLCDLGYSVTGTYTSNAILQAASPQTLIAFASGSCAPSNIIGQNDGLVSNVYTFTTTTTLTAISYSTLLANDTPSTGLQVSCLELIYNTVTLTTGLSNFSVTAPAGTGLVILKYYPQDISSGQVGNLTYVFVYFITPSCSPASACNIVENGGFESVPAGSCGGINTFPVTVVSCWREYAISNPKLFVAGCSTGTIYNLANNTLGTSPPVSSYNGTVVNTKAFGLRYFPTNNLYESLQNQLASPLIPGQTYQVSFWALNHPTSPNMSIPFETNLNNNNQSCVMNISTYPSFPVLTPTTNFPTGLNSLINFTINAGSIWTQHTGTFTVPSTLTVNQNNLLIGYNVAQTALIAAPSNSSIIETFIDDISITPISSATFVIPNANACGNTSITNLAQYTSASNGTFTGTGVSISTGSAGPQYDFNVSNTLTPGTYPILLTYTASTGCTYTLTQNIQVSPSYSLSLAYQSYCPTTSLAPTYTVSCAAYTGTPIYVWQPGYGTGAVQSLTNTSVTNTVVAQLGNCIATQTFAVSSQTMATFTQTSITSGTTLTGPLYITSDFTLQPNTSMIFIGEFIMGPSARIVVSNSASVWFTGAHLYSCGTDLWQGVVIKDGGYMLSYASGGNDVLIEDAITAIDASNQATTTINPFFSVSNTIFNKNHVDIRLGGYTANTGSFSPAFGLSNCVFTCRNLPFTNNSWPSVSTSSTGLRFASSATTGLAPPYNLLNAPIVNLKNPYTSQRSSIAIECSNMGNTSTVSPGSNQCNFSGIVINPNGGNNFNLFDAHENFIVATNSNIQNNNSVFQNTQTYSTNAVGAAIEFSCGVFNSILDLSSTSVATGNRFYDCHTAVRATNAYEFKLQNAIIRSTHSNTAISTTSYGQNGVILNTNRFYNYAVNQNELTNIGDGITVNFLPGSYTVPTSPTSNFGIYHYTMAVNANTVSSQAVLTSTASSTNYVSNAIRISSPINYSNDENPSGYTLTVNYNQLYRVYRGISYIGVGVSVPQYTNTERHLHGNTIVLEEDGSINPQQKGIELGNNWLNDLHCRFVIDSNTVNLLGANTSNSLVTLIYSGFNVGSSFRPAPRISCNILSNASRGFVFEGPNYFTHWRGNKMQNHQRGMTLLNAGVIGQQGSSGNPSDNEWNGSWTGNVALYVGASSIAQQSPLYYSTASASLIPPNFGGSALPQNWYNGSGASFTTTGTYTCGGNYPNLIVLPLPDEDDYDSPELLYSAKLTAYRWLHRHDSIRINNVDLGDFYNALGGSSIDNFTEIETLLAEGSHSAATTVLNGMDTDEFNAVETNYFNFYTLYLAYVNAGSLSSGDLEDLYDICNHCPGTNGACVFQARALYQRLVPGATFEDNCEGSARPGKGAEETQELSKVAKTWDVDLFPNPTDSRLIIVGKKESERLKIEIKDLSNRLVLKSEVKTNEFLANLEFSLINGAYFITITNDKDEHVIKKLLIAK